METYRVELTYEVRQVVEIAAADEEDALEIAKNDFYLYSAEKGDTFEPLTNAEVLNP